MKEHPPIDAARLGEWLDGTLGPGPALMVEALEGGASNLVYRVLRGESDWVLRRPPAVLSHATAHDVLREYRFLRALRDEPVRVPRAVAACEDTSVLGAPFYLMERVDGVPIRYHLPAAYVAAPECHGRVGEELVDALAEIHAVDWRAVGLADVGKPEGFLERQASRWMRQWEGYKVRDLPRAEEVARWLEENLPLAQVPGIVHGDYKTDNVLYATVAPVRILAVVDWEMATIGDPLLDLAWALLFWPELGEGNVTTLGGAGNPDGLHLESLPTRADLAARYAAGTGRDVSHLAYYTALAAWKLALVLEGNWSRYVRGLSKNPMHPAFEFLVPELLERAWRATRES
ncbi:MAG: phosphotransferase family protein [Myxococcales bacterium]|nr:phosphotransferase family protein [Myxococcales bacterium]